MSAFFIGLKVLCLAEFFYNPISINCYLSFNCFSNNIQDFPLEITEVMRF